MNKQESSADPDRDLIRGVISFYENQTDEEEVAELEAAWTNPESAFVQVPHELLPAVRALVLGIPCPPETMDEWQRLYRNQTGRARAHYQLDQIYDEAERATDEPREEAANAKAG